MRRLAFGSVLLALLSGAAPLAKLTGPASVPSGVPMLAIDAGSSASDRPLAWTMKAPDGVSLRLGTFDGSPAKSLGMVYNPPDGLYQFKVVAVGTPEGGEITADADVYTVTVGGGSPTPIPPDDRPRPRPKPDPPPAPKPPVVAGTLHVSLVYDLANLVPDMTAVRTGMEIRKAVGGLDAAYRTYPATSPALASLGLAPFVAKVGTPCLIVQSADGVVLSVEVAPTEEAAVIARIKSLRGGSN